MAAACNGTARAWQLLDETGQQPFLVLSCTSSSQRRDFATRLLLLLLHMSCSGVGDGCAAGWCRCCCCCWQWLLILLLVRLRLRLLGSWR